MGKTIHEGLSVNGLYPINLQKCSLSHVHYAVAFLGVSTSFDTWHA